MYLPWAANVMRRGLQFWRAALSFNERILADYRWHAAPFAVMRGYSNRLRAAWWQEQDGDQTGPPCGAALKITDGMIVLPDNRGVIGGATINGNPRGLNLPQSDGTVLRPDLALVDDPQDRKVAKSPVLVSETCAKIDGDVAGLGTAGAPFPLLMSGNCVLAGDVMERYIADANWRALRVSCVETWPTGWADKGPTYRLWSDWWDAYQADAKAGAAFYKANRKAMVTGMALSAPHAYKAQRSSLLPDEFCVAMRQYWQMGHEAFMAERQQSPVTIEASAALVVQPEQVLVRAVGPPRGRAPEGALRIVAGADINPGLQSRLGPRVTWAVLAFAREQVACVIAYGRERIVMPADPTQAQSAAASFAAIEQVRLKVAAVGADVLFYDARGNWSPRGLAIRYAMQRTPGIAIVPAEGWSNEYYRPTHKTAVRRFEGGHECADVVDGVRVRWIAWNADHWGEAMLRGWLAVPGAPGACVLYAGEQEHEFAEQVTMKRLVGKLATSKGIRYDWADRPGDQDYGDAVAMCWAAAAWGGIGTGGVAARPASAMARVVVSRPSGRRF
ncbi:MAG: hypothetical protein FJ388_01690 [Verrucomicrobia bacterium]|nr:hypothetical protein [Verrucomicrobiota bacterium]